ncbi:Translocon-associated protein subunit delta [Sarcoptes scabiei]|uniref:Translocon-associated protein subunit delta n=1 Tax=Sarcoptes scabiei TaxID=52283 RepID=A0A834RAU4_SARSC|nr:Translocon-associated protein subunit delta [Sarcoptes scabiei]
MFYFPIVLVSMILIVPIQSQSCRLQSTKPYSADDGLVLTSVGYMIEFSATCPKDVVPAFAMVNDRILSVVKLDDNRFQVSWTIDLALASSGSYSIPIYDDQSFQLLMKKSSPRSSDVEPLFRIDYQHTSPYRGPIVRSEFATLLVILLFSYRAISYRFKIMNKLI